MIITLVGAGAAEILSVPPIFKGEPGDGNYDDSGIQAQIQSLRDIVDSLVEGGLPSPAPTVISPPFVTPNPVTVGDNATIIQGSYNNAISVRRTLMQGTTDITSQVVDGVWSPGVSVNAVYTETPVGTNGDGITYTVNIGVDAQAQPVERLTANDFYTYVTVDDAPGAVGSGLTQLQTRGTGGLLLPMLGNAATPTPTKEVDGIRFNSGRYFLGDFQSIPASDGIILVADFTQHSVTGTSQVLSVLAGTTPFAALRTNGTTIQPYVGAAINGTAQNISAGQIALGQRITMVMEFNRSTNTLRYWDNGTQAIVSIPLSQPTPFAVTRIIFGQNANTTIHRAGIITRPSGQLWATTLEEVLTDFSLGSVIVEPEPAPTPENVTQMRFYPADGQSLEQGNNIGNTESPDTTKWRDLLNDDRVRMLSGMVRKDAVRVEHVASPVLTGYDTLISATGDTTGYAATSVPVGFLTAFALVDEYLPETTAISYQFHSAGGQSINNLDSSTADGSTVIPWENATYWMQEASRIYSNQGLDILCPGFGYNQGEADVGRARGWWLQRFTPYVAERRAQIMSSTGQTSTPVLYLNQTGGYMVKEGANQHQVVLDQIDAVRQIPGTVLAVVNYALPVDNTDGRGVHLTTEGYTSMAYLRAWAIEETEAGRDWNLLPPVSVTRSGNTITIPITVRNGESLVTTPGKYTNYGGDPSNLGLEVIGGGSITNATVSGGNIILTVSGTVTEVRYAFQMNGTDYKNFTVNNVGYVSHRGLIRTDLTRQVESRGGFDLTLERWVPSFTVAVN